MRGAIVVLIIPVQRRGGDISGQATKGSDQQITGFSLLTLVCWGAVAGFYGLFASGQGA